MPVHFKNFSYSRQLNGKPIFVPSELGERVGKDLKDRVYNAYSFKDYFFHLRKGGHVAAIHSHRPHKYFCKLDIENFFYSISRNRVVRAIREVGIPRASFYGKFSCVKNPYYQPSYSLPYGFIQSPILASLVLAQSSLGQCLAKCSTKVNLAVYVDDITMSSNCKKTLELCYAEVFASFDSSNFSPNISKCIAPTESMIAFNCNVDQHLTRVQDSRIAEFYSTQRSPLSELGFRQYCESVKSGNK
jgi:hypothetical protein